MKRKLSTLTLLLVLVFSTRGQINFIYGEFDSRNIVELGLALREFFHRDSTWNLIADTDNGLRAAYYINVNAAGEVSDAKHIGSQNNPLHNMENDSLFTTFLRQRGYLFANWAWGDMETKSETIMRTLIYNLLPENKITVKFPSFLKTKIDLNFEECESTKPFNTIDEILDASPFSECLTLSRGSTNERLIETLCSSPDYFNTLMIYHALYNQFGRITLNEWYKNGKNVMTKIMFNIDIDESGVAQSIQLNPTDDFWYQGGLERNKDVICHKMMNYFRNHNIRFRSKSKGSHHVAVEFPGLINKLERDYATGLFSFTGFCDFLSSTLYRAEAQKH